MASKRGIRRRECDGKIRYTSEEDAYERGIKMEQRRGHYGMNAYRCRFCLKFHIGHKPKVVTKVKQRKKVSI